MNPANQDLVERYLRHYNEKNVDAMLELFSEDAVFESVSNTTGIIRTTGRDELRRLAEQSAEFFGSRRQTPVQWVSAAEHVAVEIEYWCRLARDLPDGKKAGTEMELRGASFFTIRNGRICRLVDYL
jgi:ketosteroid isomerase-like protein